MNARGAVHLTKALPRSAGLFQAMGSRNTLSKGYLRIRRRVSLQSNGLLAVSSKAIRACQTKS
jgi:hypothetical protein